MSPESPAPREPGIQMTGALYVGTHKRPYEGDAFSMGLCTAETVAIRGQQADWSKFVPQTEIPVL